MAFFFRNKQSKSDVIKRTKDLLLRLEQPPFLNKTQDEISKALIDLKHVLQGTHDVESNSEIIQSLVNEMIAEDFFILLIRNIPQLQFEARKDSQAVLSAAFRFKSPTSNDEDPPALAYILDNRPETIRQLCLGYERRESATACGITLRELLKNEHVAAFVLYDEGREDEPAVSINDLDLERVQSGRGVFWRFFDYIDKSSFEASTDAFTTFRELLTRHKPLVAQYMAINFDMFFDNYSAKLMESESYVTKRQSIKLLGELLLDRANYTVMTEYVGQGDNLKQCMVMLKDDRKMVQYEGFHVFKVFVANPHKSDAVRKILIQNRERLLRFLPTFLEDRQDDDQFLDEKSFLIRQIDAMSPPEPSSQNSSLST